MRTAQFPKGDWAKIDKALLKEVKNTSISLLKLQMSMCMGNVRMFAVAFPLLLEDSDINLIDTAFKLLSSRDELCAQIALNSLRSTVHRRLGSLPDDQTLSDFYLGTLVVTSALPPINSRTRGLWRGLLPGDWGYNGFLRTHRPSLIFQDLTLKVNNRRKILFSIRDRLRTPVPPLFFAKKTRQGHGSCISCPCQFAFHC
ncbi:retrovirus-related Pol polyprotein from type-1 retrotransposable element R2 [Caerostris extrusa]|uniref:Retrovirus-related Pol polyprotein from type-1 retrotransposable element R2 n=1 Tax=Caerostris extrusa TaxID=172846 RepID=A0AAV4X4T0_CAEEX|nr:retrovirus-related Pol polyprotein from type-1 retrotransposable element R2 [Caerostris extrusa]